MNPVICAVAVMTVLCLCKVNVLISMMIGALAGGAAGGMRIEQTMGILIGGMGANAETALSYILLGTVAIALRETKLVKILARAIRNRLGKNKKILILLIAALGCLSQNLIPIHIAYIPILIPPLLGVINSLKMDRRAVACALTFSVKFPYVTLPVGYGLIFHGIIRDSMKQNNMKISLPEVSKSMLIPGISMISGLLIAIFFSYSKERVYAQPNEEESEEEKISFTKREGFALLAVASAFVIQLFTSSLPLGALICIVIMMTTRVIRFHSADEIIGEGIKLMGFVAFMMLVAAGFAAVINATGAVENLIKESAHFIGGNKIIGVFVMLLIGLLVTMGIGTSFGTVPILATIYVPLGASLGLSAASIACVLGVAGALGDAGSPASDSTLGPTSALNADGQHNHISDTCIPTFLHFNIPLLIFGTLTALLI